MTSDNTQLNLIADPEEATPDRGPLVEDNELDDAKSKIIEGSSKEVPSTSDEVLAFLEADDDDIDDQEESYIDNRVVIAREIRPMIAAWHEYKGGMAQVRANYKLWKIESELAGGDTDDQRKEALVQNASRMKKSLDFIEGEIKEAFPKLQGVAFLTRSEIILLPTWMHKILDIVITASPEERAEAEAALQEKLDSTKQQE